MYYVLTVKTIICSVLYSHNDSRMRDKNERKNHTHNSIWSRGANYGYH